MVAVGIRYASRTTLGGSKSWYPGILLCREMVYPPLTPHFYDIRAPIEICIGLVET